MSQFIDELMIIDSNHERSMLIRSAAKSEGTISSVTAVSSIDQAMMRLAKKEFQLIMVSEALVDNSLGKFIDDAKGTQGGQIACYVSIIEGAKQKHAYATQLLQGVDGIISVPFSVDSFNELLEVASEAVNNRIEERRKKLIEIALVDVITYVDATADRLRQGRVLTASSKSRENLKATMMECERANSDLYFSIVIDKFSSIGAKPPRRSVYSGASKRLRKKLERQYAEDLMNNDEDKQE